MDDKIPTTKTDKRPCRPLREVEVAYEIDESKCKDCKDRPCLQSCPIDAVHEVPPDKNIEIEDTCFGCVLCREACPYDAIKMETTLSEPIRENVPTINPKLCRRCGACVDACRTGAIQLVSSGREEAHSEIDEEKCVKCGYCARVCPTEAIKYGEILPRTVVGGKTVVIDQKDCIGCMTCTKVCPSKGAINVGNVCKLPFIDPSYCARCEECMNACPSAAIKYSSRKRAYQKFGRIKSMEIVSDLLDKETKRLAGDASKVDKILNKISRDLCYENKEDEFEIDVTDRIKEEIEKAVDGNLELDDFKDIIERIKPKRDISVIEEKCIGCTTCMDVCPTKTIELEMPSPVHIGEDCVYCGKCIEVCPSEAIYLKEEHFETQNGRIFYIRKALDEPRTGEIEIDSDICQLCGVCVNKCPAGAMSIEDEEVIIDREKCIVCDACEVTCPVHAVKLKTE